MKKNILYLSYDGMTDPLGQSQVLPYLFGLAEYYTIFLISFEKKDSLKENYEIVKEKILAKDIQWQPQNYLKKPPVLSTLYDINKMYRTASKICSENTISIVHCRSYISALVGLKLKKDFGIKLLFDMRGFWADERIDGNIWNIRNPLYHLIYHYFKKKEKEFLISSDAIISLTKTGKDEIVSWNVVDTPSKIVVIPCCVDDKLFIPGDSDDILMNKLSLRKDDFVLSYLGSIGTWYLLDEMLLLFKKLLEHRSNSRFLFITSDKKDSIQDAANRIGIDIEKLIIIKAKRNEVPQYLRLSHVSVFFIKPFYSKKASSPTKLAEVLSMGIPVICNSNVGDTDEIVRNSKAGFVLSAFNETSYSDAVKSIDSLLLLPKEDIRAVAQMSFTLEHGVKTYKQVYDSLIENKIK